MDYLLYRCSGTTFCHYTKRFQRACLSFLAHHNLLPEALKHLATFKGGRRTSYVGSAFWKVKTKQCLPYQGDVSYLKFPLVLQQISMRSCYSQPEGNVSELLLPNSVQKHLGNMSADIMKAMSVSGSESASVSCITRLARYYFEEGGKLFRPTVVLLMAGACGYYGRRNERVSNGENGSEINESQYKIAVVSEMIHAASLVHDDVIDEAEQRRNRPSLNAVWGNKKAVLVGDYILAKATQLLCSIGDSEVIRILAQVIEDLVKGEFMQMGSRDSPEERFIHYMTKTFKKTGSLFARSCQAVASLTVPVCPEDVRKIAFEYGRNLGLAFQLVDDLLDFVAKSSTLGKPVVADLKLGLATAPVLFAAKQHSELEKLIARRFSDHGDVEKAFELVMKSDGLLLTRQLAETHSREAVRMAKLLPQSEFRTVLCAQAAMQLNREK